MLSILDEQPTLIDDYVGMCQDSTKAACNCTLNPAFGKGGFGIFKTIPENSTLILPEKEARGLCEYRCFDFFASHKSDVSKIIRSSLFHHRITVSKEAFKVGKCATLVFGDRKSSTMTYPEYRSIHRFCKREGIQIALESGKYEKYAKYLLRLLQNDKDKKIKK